MNAYKNHKKRERDAETYKDEFYSAALKRAYGGAIWLNT